MSNKLETRPGPKDEVAERKRRKLNEKLDDALEETFPGSDPVSISQPSPTARDKHQT